MVARLKHLTILSEDNYTLGRFYQGLFHMRPAGPNNATDPVSISDGNIGLDIQPRLPGYRSQLDTFGIEVDDLDDIRARMQKAYPAISWTEDPTARPYATVSTHDPDGNVFGLRQAAPAKGGNGDSPQGWRQDRVVDHVGLRVLHPETVAEFYADIFGFSPVEGPGGNPNVYLSDGRVTLVIIPWRLDDFEGTGITARGLDHIGFHVESIEALKEDIDRAHEANYRFRPSTSTLGRGKEGAGRLAMFRKTCPLGCHHLSDSDGLLLDVRE